MVPEVAFCGGCGGCERWSVSEIASAYPSGSVKRIETLPIFLAKFLALEDKFGGADARVLASQSNCENHEVVVRV